MGRTFYITGLLMVIFLMAEPLWGQTSTNPFDLKYRRTRPVEKTTEPAANNPKPVIDTPKIAKKQERKPAVDKQQNPDTLKSGKPYNPFDSREGKGTASNISPEPKVDRDTTKKENSVLPDVPLPEGGKKRNSMLLLIVLSISLIATLVISYNRSVVQRTWRAMLNDNYLNLIYREQKTGISIQYLFLYFIFMVNAGLFIYLTIGFFRNESFPVLWRCIAFVGIIYLIRHLVLTYLAGIYPFKKEVQQYGFTILIFNVFYGIILLPLNAFVAFSPPAVSKVSMYIGLTFFGLLLIFRLLRGLFIGSRYIFDQRFHFFIYLCATEIAPIFLVIKFFKTFLI